MKYSDNETKMFNDLGFSHLVYSSLEPCSVYRVAVEEAFLKDLHGPAVDALRRGANAYLVHNKPFRMTPEFDKLVQY